MTLDETKPVGEKEESQITDKQKQIVQSEQDILRIAFPFSNRNKTFDAKTTPAKALHQIKMLFIASLFGMCFAVSDYILEGYVGTRQLLIIASKLLIPIFLVYIAWMQKKSLNEYLKLTSSVELKIDCTKDDQKTNLVDSLQSDAKKLDLKRIKILVIASIIGIITVNLILIGNPVISIGILLFVNAILIVSNIALLLFLYLKLKD